MEIKKNAFKSLNHSAEENLLSYLEENEELYGSILAKIWKVEETSEFWIDDYLELTTSKCYRCDISMNGKTVLSQESKCVCQKCSYYEHLEDTLSIKKLTSSEFKEYLFKREEFFYAVLEYLISIKNNFVILLHKKAVEQNIVECERRIADLESSKSVSIDIKKYEEMKADLVAELGDLQEILGTENGHPGKQGAMKVIVKKRKFNKLS